MLDALVDARLDLSEVQKKALRLLQKQDTGKGEFAGTWCERLERRSLEIVRRGTGDIPADLLPVLAEAVGDPEKVFRPYMASRPDGPQEHVVTWKLEDARACSQSQVSLGRGRGDSAAGRAKSQPSADDVLENRIFEVLGPLAEVTNRLKEGIDFGGSNGREITQEERERLLTSVRVTIPRLINLKPEIVRKEIYGAWSVTMLQGLRQSQKALGITLGVTHANISRWMKVSGSNRLPASALPLFTHWEPYRVLGPFVEAVGWRFCGTGGHLTDQRLIQAICTVEAKRGDIMRTLGEARAKDLKDAKGPIEPGDRKKLAGYVTDIVCELTKVEGHLSPGGSKEDLSRGPPRDRVDGKAVVVHQPR